MSDTAPPIDAPDEDAITPAVLLRILWVVVRLVPVVWLMRAGETFLYQGF